MKRREQRRVLVLLPPLELRDLGEALLPELRPEGRGHLADRRQHHDPTGSDELAGVESNGLVFAIAQIVYTAAGITSDRPDGTYQVVIQIDGETITVPDDEGVELDRPVRRHHHEGRRHTRGARSRQEPEPVEPWHPQVAHHEVESVAAATTQRATNSQPSGRSRPLASHVAASTVNATGGA